MLKIHSIQNRESIVGIAVIAGLLILGIVTLTSVGISLASAYRVQTVKKSSSTIDEAALSKAVSLLEELEKEN